MEQLFRLEFNEKQQQFNCAYPNKSQKANTFGWRTIADNCSDIEFYAFEAFVNRTKRQGLTVEYLLKSLSEFMVFWSNLLEYGLSIGYEKNIDDNFTHAKG